MKVIDQIPPAAIAKFNRRARRHQPGCWLWHGERQSQKPLPYGLFRYTDAAGRRRAITSHKLAWLLAHPEVDDVPAGQEISHTCHHQLCCNPAHLKTTTHADNVALVFSQGRKSCRYAWHRLQPAQRAPKCPQCGERNRRAA